MPVLGDTDSSLRPLLRFIARGQFGREQTIEARFDSGFDGYLAIPPSVVAALGLEYVRDRMMGLADGRIETFAEYRIRILWDGFERPIRVLAKAGAPLAGVAMFQGYRACIEFVDGGMVETTEIV